MFSNTTDILRSDRRRGEDLPAPPPLTLPRISNLWKHTSEGLWRPPQERPINPSKSSFKLVTLSLSLFDSVQDKLTPDTDGRIIDQEELETQEDRFKICSSNLGMRQSASNSTVQINLSSQDAVNQLLRDVAEALTELSQLLISVRSAKVIDPNEEKPTWKCPLITCEYYESGFPTEQERDHHVEQVHAARPWFRCKFHTCPFESQQEIDYTRHLEMDHASIDTGPTEKDGPAEKVAVAKDSLADNNKDHELNKEESAAILLDVISDAISKLLKLASTPGVRQIKLLDRNKAEEASNPPSQGGRGLWTSHSATSGPSSSGRSLGPTGSQQPSTEGGFSIRTNSVANLLTPPGSPLLAPRSHTGDDNIALEPLDRSDKHVRMLAEELTRLKIIPSTRTVDKDVLTQAGQSQPTFQSRYIPDYRNAYMFPPYSPSTYGPLSFGSGRPAISSSFGLPRVDPPVDRPFKCDQCQQSFNREHDLKRHKRIHLAVKPFPCLYCDKSFSRKDALKRHILVKGCGKVDQASGSKTASDLADGGDDDTDEEHQEPQSSGSGAQVTSTMSATALGKLPDKDPKR